MNILNSKDILQESNFLETAASVKIFECSPLSSKLRKQTSVKKKQCKRLDKVFESNKRSKTKQKTKNVVRSEI